jgi:hypothetical protein
MVGHIQSPPIDALKIALASLQNAAEAGDEARARRCLAALIPESQLSGVSDVEALPSGRLLDAPILNST